MRLPDQSGVKTQAGAKTWTDHGFPGPGLGSLRNGDKKMRDCLLIDHHSGGLFKALLRLDTSTVGRNIQIDNAAVAEEKRLRNRNDCGVIWKSSGVFIYSTS